METPPRAWEKRRVSALLIPPLAASRQLTAQDELVQRCSLTRNRPFLDAVIPYGIRKISQLRVDLLINLTSSTFKRLHAFKVGNDVPGFDRVHHQADIARCTQQSTIQRVNTHPLARIGIRNPEAEPVTEHGPQLVADQRPVVS